MQVPEKAYVCPYCKKALRTSPRTWGCLIAFLLFISAPALLESLRGKTPSASGNSSQKAASTPAPAERVISDWDIEYSVKMYLKSTLRDPNSLTDLKIVGIDRGGYAKSCLAEATYRAKNGFGGYNVERRLFLLAGDGTVADSAEWSEGEKWRGLRAVFKRKEPKAKAPAPTRSAQKP